MMFRALLFAFLLLPLPAVADNTVRASVLADSQSVEAGKPLRIGVLLEAPEGWHTYWKDPGDAGLATTLEWVLPVGFTASAIDWPPPSRFSEGTLTTYGYSGNTLLPVTVSVPEPLSGGPYIISVHAQWLACKEICIPESQMLSLELPAGDGAPSAQAALFDKKQMADTPILLTLCLALLGGLVLNLMPCVLPVLSLKALSVARKSGAQRAQTVWHGVAYTLGVLASFSLLASVLIGLQQAGFAVGWGYQMQSPEFVVFLIYLLFLVGLNLSGLFYLPVLLGGVGSDLANKNSVRGSFFTGVLAALVASPCTAPFMASAVGVALTLPPWAAMLVFLALGFGLALPFLLISIFPAMLRFLPKPGAWMERFRECLAFPMYGAVVWLLWVLGLQAGAGSVACVLAGLVLIVFVLWLKKIFPHTLLYRVLALAAAVAIMWFSFSMAGKTEMPSVPYSKAALEHLRAQGKAVYVDATAAWCITCQLNARVALHTQATQEAFAAHGVTLMVADWTRRNPEVTEFLQSFGYNGVPLNVFYPADGAEPVVLPQVLSEASVIRAVTR